MKNTMYRFHATVVLGAMLLLAGCVQGKAALDARYRSPSGADDPLSHTPPCKISVARVLDVRDDKTSMGRFGRRRVPSIEVVEWVTDALVKRGYDLVAESAPKPGSRVVDVHLRLAYVRDSAGAFVTNVVIGIPRPESETTYYRGTDTGYVWSDTDATINKSFNNALSRALILAKNDLSKDCRA